MEWLARRRFARALDIPRVEAAIAAAERRTSGEIVVSVSRWFWGSLQPAAEHAFARLGVLRTAERNGVLIFIVPARRQFVILGDRGIHERVGQAFWEQAAQALERRFRAGDLTGGLVDGIAEIGARLAADFPPPADGKTNPNELGDTVDRS